MEILEAYNGEMDDGEHEEAQDHLVYDVHDSEAEGDAHGKGGSKEVNTKDQRTPSLTEEVIEEAVEMEVAGIIKDLVEQEVERSVDEVFKEIDEESVGKEYGSMGRDPILAISFPTSARIGGNNVVAVQEQGIGYINNQNK
ncbi:hypothetical protein KI387_021879, partial [Taxus chinensis]